MKPGTQPVDTAYWFIIKDDNKCIGSSMKERIRDELITLKDKLHFYRYFWNEKCYWTDNNGNTLTDEQLDKAISEYCASQKNSSDLV